jgi:hypothetical protein
MTIRPVVSLSVLFTVARDMNAQAPSGARGGCPVCGASLNVVSSRATGARIECAEGHPFECRIEASHATGTPRMGSAIGVPVYPYDTETGYHASDVIGHPFEGGTTGTLPTDGI